MFGIPACYVHTYYQEKAEKDARLAKKHQDELKAEWADNQVRQSRRDGSIEGEYEIIEEQKCLG